MSQVLADLRYAKSHEWARTLSDGRIEVGITDHAQHALGDLVFVDVPQVGTTLEVGGACAVVESVKAARQAGKTRDEVRAILEQARPIRDALKPAMEALHTAIRAVFTDAQRAWLDANRPPMPGGLGPIGRHGRRPPPPPPGGNG